MSDHSDASEQDLRARAETAERDLQDAVRAAEQRVIRAELKAEALKAGMIDLDGIKLVETDSLALNEKGELSGGASLMQQLKRAKPWLFGSASSSSGAVPPPAVPPKPKLATEMTRDEWRAARADLLKRR